MKTHSSTFVWGIPWTEKPGRLQSVGCKEADTTEQLTLEHVIRNAGLDELQAGIKIGMRNTNNLRHADDTTLMAESEDELKSLLMRVKEGSENSSLKLNIKKKKKKTEIMASNPITSWQVEEKRWKQ